MTGRDVSLAINLSSLVLIPMMIRMQDYFNGMFYHCGIEPTVIILRDYGGGLRSSYASSSCFLWTS